MLKIPSPISRKLSVPTLGVLAVLLGLGLSYRWLSRSPARLWFFQESVIEILIRNFFFPH